MFRASGLLLAAAVLGFAPGIAHAQDRAARHVETFVALCEATAAMPGAAISTAEGMGWTGSTPDPTPAEYAAGAERFRETRDGAGAMSLMVSLVTHNTPGGPTPMNDCSLADEAGDVAAVRARFEALTGLTPSTSISSANAVGYFYLLDGGQRRPLASGLSRDDYMRNIQSDQFRMVFIGGETVAIISATVAVPPPAGSAQP